MTSGLVAALIAVLALGFVEGIARFYPSRRTWLRLRSVNGIRAVRAMRERLEAAAASRLPRVLAQLLLSLVLVWIAVASWLDKRWQEVALDVFPYVLIGAAFLRTPSALRAIAARMKDHERESGFDPDEVDERGDGGPAAIAL